jgi:PAS domain S-box-containing protein
MSVFDPKKNKVMKDYLNFLLFFSLTFIFCLICSFLIYFSGQNNTSAFLKSLTDSHLSFFEILFLLCLLSIIISIFLSLKSSKLSALKKNYIEKLSENLISTLNASGNAVISTDAEGNICYINPLAQSFCLCTDQSSLDKPLDSILKLKIQDKILTTHELLDKIKNASQPLKLSENVFLITNDNLIRKINLNLTPLLDDSSNFIGTLIVFYDITEKVNTEDALQKSEERFKNLTFLLPLTVYETDNQANITYVNQKGLETFGYDQADLEKGVNAFSLIQAQFDEINRMNKILKNSSFDNTIERRESIGVKKDGTHFPILVFSNVILQDKQPVGFRGIVIDLSDQKSAELALSKSEEKFKNITENMSDMAWTIDMQFRTTYVTPSVQRILGFTVEEYLKRPIDSNYAPESLIEIVKSVEENILLEQNPNIDKKRSKIMEVQQYKADGSLIWVSLNASFIRNSEGVPIGLQGVTRDISELKNAELEKDKLYSQLLQSQKMESIGRLAGGVAHDFNNMLGVIIGHSDFALHLTKNDELLQNHLTEIRKAADRSANLTKQLLTFARKQETSPKVLDLNSTIEGMLKLLRRLIGEDVELSWQPGYNLWPIKVDPSHIDQILANLCVNAKDAITSNGKITIETHNKTLNKNFCNSHPGFTPGNYVCLTVKDNGSGIDEELLPQIFEPFFTTKELGKGTGLGLATIYGAVKQNNGYITVESKIESGTTFYIYFPQFIFPVDQDSPEDDKPALKTGNETILLVEDEESVLNLTAMMLENLGYTVIPFNKPLSALNYIKTQSGIDLLITDIIMPEMNGRDLAENILAFYPDLKILLISGYTSNVIDNQEIKNLKVPLLQKPFSMAEISEKIRQILDN